MKATPSSHQFSTALLRRADVLRDRKALQEHLRQRHNFRKPV